MIKCIPTFLSELFQDTIYNYTLLFEYISHMTYMQFILCLACGGQPNCASCNVPGKCSTCSQGYTLSLDGTKCNGK